MASQTSFLSVESGAFCYWATDAYLLTSIHCSGWNLSTSVNLRQ